MSALLFHYFYWRQMAQRTSTLQPQMVRETKPSLPSLHLREEIVCVFCVSSFPRGGEKEETFGKEATETNNNKKNTAAAPGLLISWQRTTASDSRHCICCCLSVRLPGAGR